MKKNKSRPQGLDKFLPQLANQQGWAEQLDLHSVFLQWNDLVESDIADHCQPQKIVKNVLWVEVENSAWLQQLQFQTLPLLDILNRSFKMSKLKGLRFCLATKEQIKKVEKEQSLRYVQPSVQDVEAFEKQTETISDKDSRDALVRLWYLAHACKKE
ncbi:MAG: DUF721 domain-containing protein [Desulfocapsa sp.]|nr:DUF721 domain-containing protein [Desulfocapsa sp.]